MSQNEVQANSVIYSRKDYINVLAEAERAFAILTELREEQITAWKGDTVAREADIDRILEERFTQPYRYSYSVYVNRLQSPTRLSWWRNLLGLKAENKVDIYGSVKAYVEAKSGQSFEEYKISEIKRVSKYGSSELSDLFMWFASNSEKFTANEWEDKLKNATRMLTEVQYGNSSAQFIIPRETFDEYASASILADSGKIDEVKGQVNWYTY